MTYKDQCSFFGIVLDNGVNGRVENRTQTPGESERIPSDESESLSINSRSEVQEFLLQCSWNIPNRHTDSREDTSSGGDCVYRPSWVDSSQSCAKPRSNNSDSIHDRWELIDLRHAVPVCLQPKIHVRSRVRRDDHGTLNSVSINDEAESGD